MIDLHRRICSALVLPALAAAMLLIGCAAGPGPAFAARQAVKMRLASPTAGDITLEWMKALQAGVEARGGGRIKVEIHPAGRLGSIAATIESVQLGTLESTIPATGFLAGVDPRFQVLDLPGIFDNLAHAQRVLADPEVAKHYSGFVWARASRFWSCSRTGRPWSFRTNRSALWPI